MSEPECESHHPAIPSRFQKRTLWSAITAFSIVLIGAIAVGVLMLSGTVLSYLQPVLVPLAVAGIIAYLLEPIVRWLQKKGWSHKWAMLSVYIGFMVLIVVLVLSVLVPTFGQAHDLFEKKETLQDDAIELLKKSYGSLQEYIGTGVASEYYDKGFTWLSEDGPEIAQRIGAWIWERLRGAFGFFGYVLGLLLVPIYLYYFLREGHTISETWSDYLPLRASNFKDEVVETLNEVNGYLISFFRGQMVVSLIDGALVAVALSFIGLPYALLIGVFLAIFGLIPYIGNMLVMIPAILIAIAHFGATETAIVVGDATPEVGEVAQVKMVESGKVVKKTIDEVSVTPPGEPVEVEVLVNAWNFLPQVWAYPLMVLLIFVILQQINGLVTAPKIVGDSVGLHPLTVIFSVLFWSLLLGGLLGALMAVPLTASIKVLFRRYIWKRSLEAAVDRRFSGGDDPDSDDEGDGPADEDAQPSPA